MVRDEFLDLVSLSQPVIFGIGPRSAGGIDLGVGEDDAESRPSGMDGKTAEWSPSVGLADSTLKKMVWLFSSSVRVAVTHDLKLVESPSLTNEDEQVPQHPARI
jgi:hypothetical protein